MTLATSRPGATNSRYVTPATSALRSSTRPPSPTPIAPRNSSGARRLENTEPRHSRLNTRASRSTTRRRGGVTGPSLLLERAPRQAEEDVLQGAAAHEDGGRAEAVPGQPLGGGVAVGGV